MSWLKPDDAEDVVYEFFAPFAHVEGRYEACRIRSPTHGVFDVFILLDPEGTDRPATVYVKDDAGETFMRTRYPECETVRVGEGDLLLEESDDGRTVSCRVSPSEGSVRSIDLVFRGDKEATPEAVPYGGQGNAVWGNKRLTCWGVDLVIPAKATGRIERTGAEDVDLDDEPALVTLGSFARIAPRDAA